MHVASLQLAQASSWLRFPCIKLHVWGHLCTQLWEMHGEQLRKGEMELALTGKAFTLLQASGAHDDLLLYTRIFARFTPEQKVCAADCLCNSTARRCCVFCCLW